MKKFFLVILCMGISGLRAQEFKEIWSMTQDFVKFGKKEAYENLKKEWIEGFSLFTQDEDLPSLFAIEGLDNPEYIYLVPVKRYGGIERFVKQMRRYTLSLPEEKRKVQKQMFASVLNFRINSLHEYRANCSYVPPNGESFLEKLPYVHYYIYGINMGTEDFFEQHLQKMVGKYAGLKSNMCWRVWKVLYGADVPKYVIGVFTKNQDELHQQIKELKFRDISTQEIIRKQEEGEGKARLDLSSLSYPRLSH